MYLGNRKKQNKGMSSHCNINKLPGFQQTLREGVFANVRIIFKIACHFIIDILR